MIKKVSNILCVLLLISLIFSNTRVSFNRPGSVIRTPGRSPYIAPYTTIVGFSAELLNTQEVITTFIRKANKITFYTLYGNVFAYFMLTITCILLLLSIFRNEKKN